jgi:hypothetical protein
MEMSCQLHAPAALPTENNPATHTGGHVGLTTNLDGFEQGKISILCHENRNMTFRLPSLYPSITGRSHKITRHEKKSQNLPHKNFVTHTV